MDENIKIQRMNNAINYLDAENKKRIETIKKIKVLPPINNKSRFIVTFVC